MKKKPQKNIRTSNFFRNLILALLKRRIGHAFFGAIVMFSLLLITLHSEMLHAPAIVYSSLSSSLRSTVTEDNGNLYFGTSDGFYYSLDGRGKTRWATEFNDFVFNSPSFRGDTMYVSSFDGKVYSLNKNSGSKQSQILVDDYIQPDTGPLLVKDTVLMGARDGYLYAFTADLKSLKWKFKATTRDITSLGIDEHPTHFGTFTVDADTVYINSSNNMLFAVNLYDGKLKWSYTSYKFHYENPIINGNLVLFSDNMGQLVVLDKHSGKLLWEVPFHSIFGTQTPDPYINQQQLYFIDNLIYVLSDAHLYAYDRSTGEEKFIVSDSTLLYTPPVLFVNNYIVLASLFTQQTQRSYLERIDSRSGIVIWSLSSLGRITYLAHSNDTVYVTSSDGNVYAVDPKDGKITWEYLVNGIPEKLFISSNALFLVAKGPGKKDSVIAIDFHTGKKINELQIENTNGTTWIGKSVYALEAGNADNTFISTARPMRGTASELENALWTTWTDTPTYIIGTDVDKKTVISINKSLFATNNKKVVERDVTSSYHRSFVSRILHYLQIPSSRPILEPQSQSLIKGKTYELTFQYSENQIDNPWEDISISGVFRKGDSTFHVNGFYYDINTWKLRFKPPSSGVWKWTVSFSLPNHFSFQNSGSVNVSESADKGFLTIDSSGLYPFVFEHTKEPFFGIGFQDVIVDYDFDGNPINQWGYNNPPTANSRINYTDLSTYLSYYRKGFNLFRWGLGNQSFKLYKNLSQDGNWYGINEGIFGDRLVQTLKEKDYRVMMSLFSFETPFDSRLDAESTSSISKYLDYAISRYSSYVDIWEVFNESNATTKWLNYVKSYIATHDQYHHPITTNWERPDLPGLAVSSVHWYETPQITNLDLLVQNKIKIAQQWGKPVIFSEVGNSGVSWDAQSALRMRIKTWISLFNQSIFIFWNDPRLLYRNPNNANIYIGDTELGYMKIIQDFFSSIRSNVHPIQITTDNSGVRLYAVSSAEGIFAYVFNSDTSNIDTTTITFTSDYSGMISLISPETGEILQENQAKKGINTIRIDSLGVDMAIKFIYKN